MKTFISIILIIFIVFDFAFIILRLQARSSENNFFNANLRDEAGKWPILRKALALHNDGDAKYDYLGNRYSKIQIEIDEMQGEEISTDAIQLMVSNMANVTGKKISYFISDTNIPHADSVTIGDIDSLSQKYRQIQSSGDTAVVYMLSLSTFADQKDQVGSTYREDGILLFSDVLKRFTVNSPAAYSNYVESTALHEFGHQLGLEHNDFSDCLMLATVDVNPNGGVQAPSAVTTDFCSYEKQLIQNKRTQ